MSGSLSSNSLARTTVEAVTTAAMTTVTPDILFATLSDVTCVSDKACVKIYTIYCSRNSKRELLQFGILCELNVDKILTEYLTKWEVRYSLTYALHVSLIGRECNASRLRRNIA